MAPARLHFLLAALQFGLLLPLSVAAEDLLIRDVTLISPERDQPLAGAQVLLRDGRIAAVSATSLSAPGARVIDGRGRFLLPGLIDSHVHLNHATGLKRRYTKDFARLYADFQRQQPRSFLYYGYTTLIENNGDPEVDRQFDAAPLRPHREHCGPALVLSDDFMATDFDSPAEFHAAFPNFLHDAHAPHRPSLPKGADPAAHTPAAAVARIAESGARCVKLYYEEALWWPGAGKPAFGLPSAELLRAVVSEAHRRGLSVLLHGNTPAAHRIGLEAGVDVMAHGLWDWPGAMYAHAHIPDDVLAVADAVAGSRMAVQPTWMAGAGMASLFDPDSLADPRLAEVLPPAYLDYLKGPAQQARADYLRRFGPAIVAAHARGDSATAEPAEVIRSYLERYRQILTRQHRAGARFLFGSDTAVGTPGWGNPPGLSGYREMKAWVAAGIDLRTLLQAATLGNARAFGLEKEIGSIEPGKRADLLLLTANPLLDVAAWEAIDTVILAGRALPRAELSAQPVPGSLRIDGARLLSPPYQGASAPTTVYIENGRLTAQGGEAEARVAEQVIDARGQFLMPGLIDAHVHISHVAGFSDADYQRHAELLPAYFAQLPRSYLYFGFTTLLDPDLSARTRERWQAAALRPRLLGCGRGIRWPNSYGPGLFPAEDGFEMFPNWVYDPAQAAQIPARFRPEDYSAEAAVKRALDAEAVCIKTYYQPAWPGRAAWPLPDADSLSRISAAAHAAGKPLMLHATSLEAYRMGLATGADLFAHGLWKQEAPFGPVDAVAGAAVMAEIARAGKAVVPTLRVLAGEREGSAAVLADPRISATLPSAFLAWARGPSGSLARQEALPPKVSALLQTMQTGAGKLLKAYADQGGRIAFGSDTPADEGLGNPPGLNGRLELDALAAAGLSPAQILNAATRDAARTLGLDAELGGLEHGQRADLLLLETNPLEQGMSAFDRIRWVIRDGQALPRAALRPPLQ